MAAIEYETKENVAIITLNRPEARNAVNGDIAQGMEAALDNYEANDDLRCAILRANGKAFCAGADLKLIAAGRAGEMSTSKGGFAGLIQRDRVKPLIAAVTGSALAGGTEVALSCDMIVAADNTNFGLPEVKRSLIAAAGGVFRLPRVIGKTAAMEVIMTGDPLPSTRAYELGMINYVVPEEQVMEKAEELANRVAVNAPLAVQASRRLASRALLGGEDIDHFKAGSREFAEIAKTEDFKEGPKAFIEKRAPIWKGR